jgi:hypothetical protein
LHLYFSIRGKVELAVGKGKVIINDGVAKAGDIVKVSISEVLDYDLVGQIVSIQ